MTDRLQSRKDLEGWISRIEDDIPGFTEGTDPGFTYVVRSRNRYKIGYTVNLSRRISDLQVANADRIELVCYWVSLCAQVLEKEIHLHFWHRRLRGEWFKLNKQEVITLQRWAKKNSVPTYLAADREIRERAVRYPS